MVFLAALLIAHAHAASDLVKVAGVVQYVDGSAQKVEEAGTKAELAYQTPVYAGDLIETKAGSTVKLASRSGCLVVLRGEGRLEIRKTWAYRGDSVRLICNGRRDALSLASSNVVVQSGEALIVDNDKLLVMNGIVKVGRVVLEPRKLYQVDKSGAKPLDKSDVELREMNSAQKPPRESFAWPSPETVSTARVMFGPAFEYEHAFYDNKTINEGKLTGLGPRLQFQFKTQDDHGLLIQLSQSENENPSRQSSPNSPPPAGVSSTVERLLLELGRRAHYDRWWSPYWRLGAGYAKAKVGFVDSFNGYSRFSYEFYVLSATYGVDAHLSPRFLRPFGVFAGAEVQLLESIARGGRINENSGFSQPMTIPDQPWRLTTLNAGVNAGLEFNF